MSLLLHRGCNKSTYGQMASVITPESTSTWFPVPHVQVFDTSVELLGQAGFNVNDSSFSLSKDGLEMFAVAKLESSLAEGVSLAVGIRNSNNKKFPLGFCAGSSVYVCDNLAFTSELIVNRRHTKNGKVRFREAISLAVGKLGYFQRLEEERISVLKDYKCDDVKAESIILRALEKEIISTRNVLNVLSEWREPSFDAFKDRTGWSLYNAFTTVLGPSRTANPNRYADATMHLYGLLGVNSCLEMAN